MCRQSDAAKKIELIATGILRKKDFLDKVKLAVKERLNGLIQYWDKRAIKFREKGDMLNYEKADRKATDFAERLTNRLKEIELERKISLALPIIVWRSLIVPAGHIKDDNEKILSENPDARKEIEHSNRSLAKFLVSQLRVEADNDNFGFLAGTCRRHVKASELRQQRISSLYRNTLTRVMFLQIFYHHVRRNHYLFRLNMNAEPRQFLNVRRLTFGRIVGKEIVAKGAPDFTSFALSV